jgi:predicted Zn-dependent protease
MPMPARLIRGWCRCRPPSSAGLQEVEILSPEGLRLADIRPMARMNVSVIVEQGGRREQGGTGGGGRFGLARLMEREPLATHGG